MMDAGVPNSPRRFLTDILNTLSSLPSPGTTLPANPLASAAAPAELKSLLLTLHALFPHELLPALDLLDRRLLTRLIPRTAAAAELAGTESAPTEIGDRNAAVYYVQSAALAPSADADGAAAERGFRGRGRPRRNDAELGAGSRKYEVRLRAWNCSCPAFTFAAFGGGARGAAGEGTEVGVGEGGGQGEWVWGGDGSFGGLRRGGEAPVCKHLLACVLVERCGVLGGFVEERVVGWDEMAGWAARWVE